jgi:hypothetical protein
VVTAAWSASTIITPSAVAGVCARPSRIELAMPSAQSLMQRFADRVVRLPMPSAELDIDRPEDLLALDVATQVKRQQLSDS